MKYTICLNILIFVYTRLAYFQKMFENVEFRSVIRFLLLKGSGKKEIINQLQEVYGKEAPSKATIYNWIREFSSGRTSVFDASKSGRPVEINEEITEKLKDIVTNERKITQMQLSERLNVCKRTVQLLLEQMGIRKLCSRFVPRFLTAEMMARRKMACESNLRLLDAVGPNFLSNIITTDETPLSLYIPYSKRESKEWVFENEKPSKVLRLGISHRKCAMLTVFWDRNGILKLDFTEEIIKSDYYSNLILETRRIRRKPRSQELYLLHDNAPIHTSKKTQETLTKAGFVQLDHPPYSPDLAPSDFWLFNHLKKLMRGKKFVSKDDMKDNVTTFLMQNDQNFFEMGFNRMVDRWKKCVIVNGGYVEK